MRGKTIAILLVVAVGIGGLLWYRHAADRGSEIPEGTLRPDYDFSRSPISKAPEGAPNVILISIDTLRADHLGCYGYERDTSPAIDRLAAEGAVAEWAISSTSWTLPSHMAMFSSLPDSVHGVEERERRYAVDHPLLAEVMKEAGYATAGFYAGPFLHPGYGFRLGFDDYVNCTTFVVPEGQSVEEFRKDKSKGDRASRFDVTGPRIHDRVSGWLGAKMEEPFFLFIHYWDVHSDYIPPAPYDTMFDPDYQGDLDVHDVAHNEAIHAGMDPRDLEHLIALYDGEIRWTDSWIEKLLGVLEERGVRDRTAIVITSDHGEAFFEHGGKGHGEDLYDEVIRVPLVIWYPGAVRAGVRVRQQVRTIDIYPTILELAGLDPIDGAIGRSLAPILRGDADSVDLPPATAELGHVESDRHRPYVRALRTGEWKVVEQVRSGEMAYYDLFADPGERAPLAPAAGGEDAASAALARFREHVEALGVLRDSMTRIGSDTFEVSPEMLARLRALGYVK